MTISFILLIFKVAVLGSTKRRARRRHRRGGQKRRPAPLPSSTFCELASSKLPRAVLTRRALQVPGDRGRTPQRALRHHCSRSLPPRVHCRPSSALVKAPIVAASPVPDTTPGPKRPPSCLRCSRGSRAPTPQYPRWSVRPLVQHPLSRQSPSLRGKASGACRRADLTSSAIAAPIPADERRGAPSPFRLRQDESPS